VDSLSMGNKGDHSISGPGLKMETEKRIGGPSTRTIIGKASPEILEQSSSRKTRNHNVSTRMSKPTVQQNRYGDCMGEVTSL